MPVKRRLGAERELLWNRPNCARRSDELLKVGAVYCDVPLAPMDMKVGKRLLLAYLRDEV